MEQISTSTDYVIPVEPGLELSPLTPRQVPELYALLELNRDRLREWLPWLGVHYGASDLRQYAADRELDNRNGTSFTACIVFQGRVCGAIGLHRIDQRHRSSSIGYWLASEFEGQGIMTRACAALITHGFRNLGLHRIEIRCATGNLRSTAIARRLGFTEEGMLREAEWLYDHWVDLRVFSMLEQHWNVQLF